MAGPVLPDQSTQPDQSTPQPHIGGLPAQSVQGFTGTPTSGEPLFHWGASGSPQPWFTNPINAKLQGGDVNNWLTQPLSENNPLPWQVYLPNQTSDIGTQKMQQGMDPSFYQNELNQNVQKPGTGMANAPGMMNDQSMNNNPMTAALQSRAQTNLNTQLQGTQNQIAQNAPMQQSQALATASDVMGKQYQIELNNFKEQYSFQQQRQQAYNAWVNSQNAATASYVGSAIGGMAVIGAAASDINLKKNIKDGRSEIQDFLDSFRPYQYEYINPYYGAGTYVSPMAQDLEKTSLGRFLVINTPNGKMVDYGKAFGLIVASLSQINERMSKLEEKNHG